MQNVTSYLAGIGVFLSLFLSSLIAVRRESGERACTCPPSSWPPVSRRRIRFCFPPALPRPPHLVKTYIPPQFLLAPCCISTYPRSWRKTTGLPGERFSTWSPSPFPSSTWRPSSFLPGRRRSPSWKPQSCREPPRTGRNGSSGFTSREASGLTPSRPWPGSEMPKKTAGKASVQVRHIRAWLRLFLSGVLGALALFLVVDGFMLAGAPLVRFNSSFR